MLRTSAISRTFLGSSLAAALAITTPAYAQQRILVSVDFPAGSTEVVLIEDASSSQVEGELVDPTMPELISFADQLGTIIWGQAAADTIIWGQATADTIIWGQSAADTIIWGQIVTDTIIWGQSVGDTIIWGQDLAAANGPE